MDEYSVTITDLEEDTDTFPTRKDIIEFFNKEIRSRRSEALTVKGVEVDIPSDWRPVLLKEYNILDEYKKIGWKVMWYNRHSLGPGRGELLRSWVAFKSPNAKER